MAAPEPSAYSSPGRIARGTRMGIVVVTDSGSDLTRRRAPSSDRTSSRCTCIFGNERFRDGVDIDRPNSTRMSSRRDRNDRAAVCRTISIRRSRASSPEETTSSASRSLRSSPNRSKMRQRPPRSSPGWFTSSIPAGRPDGESSRTLRHRTERTRKNGRPAEKLQPRSIRRSEIRRSYFAVPDVRRSAAAAVCPKPSSRSARCSMSV